MNRIKDSLIEKMMEFLRNQQIIYCPYTFLRGLLVKKLFRQTRSILIFLGYPRSGSSTLASILDAHPNVIISHELDLLKYLKGWFGRNQLLFMIRKNSILYSKSDRVSAGYPGVIKGQHNGNCHNCLIAGDKKAGRSAVRIKNNPELLNVLQKRVGLPLRIVHIVRNPFDMIATQAYGGQDNFHVPKQQEIIKAMQLCFTKFDTMSQLLENGNYDIHTIYHEQLIRNPEDQLKKLFTWLEIDVSPEYLEACKNHLFTKPKVSRLKISWDRDLVNEVEKKINSVSFLKGYSFDQDLN